MSVAVPRHVRLQQKALAAAEARRAAAEGSPAERLADAAGAGRDGEVRALMPRVPPAALHAALRRAVEADRLGAARLLLEHRRARGAADGDGGVPPVVLAARLRGRAAMVAVLLEGGEDPNAETPQGTAVGLALALGERETAAALLAAGADLARAAPGGVDPALHAALTSNDGLLDALLEAGAPLDGGNENGMTALMAAAAGCQRGMIERLLRGGARPDAADRDGLTAVEHAFRGGRRAAGLLPTVALLLEAGAPASGEALARAARGRRGDPSLVRLLIEYGAPVNGDPSPSGITPLMVAALYGATATVRELLEQGADPLLRDSSGRRAYDMCLGSLRATRAALRVPTLWQRVVRWFSFGGAAATPAHAAPLAACRDAVHASVERAAGVGPDVAKICASYVMRVPRARRPARAVERSRPAAASVAAHGQPPPPPP